MNHITFLEIILNIISYCIFVFIINILNNALSTQYRIMKFYYRFLNQKNIEPVTASIPSLISTEPS